MNGFIEEELYIDPFWYVIWEPENLEEYNQDYGVCQNVPEFRAFGSNGANELLVIDSSGYVYTIPAIGMDVQCAEKIADSVQHLKQFVVKNKYKPFKPDF